MSTLDRDRLTVTILYLKHQQLFYCDYAAALHMLSDFCLVDKEFTIAPVRSMHADICGSCLTTFDMISAGRVRDYCEKCQFATRKDSFLQLLWLQDFAKALRCSQMVAESYLAEALYRIKVTQEQEALAKKQAKQRVNFVTLLK